MRRDCRHYSTRTVGPGSGDPGGETVQRCRVGASLDTPFACPPGCLFFEPRSITDAGWQRFGPEPGPGVGPGWGGEPTD